ncbi:MAG: CBS domain-containing protein [Candidatus Methanofastidiosia archaeon]
MFSKRNVFQYASRRVITCLGEDEILNVMKLMAKENIRRVPVLNAKAELVGIVAVTDFLKNLKEIVGLELKGRSTLKVPEFFQKPTSSIMTRKVVYVDKNSSIQDAIEAMITRDVGALPILEDRRLCGIITERDFLHLIDRIYPKENSEKLKVSDLMSTKVFTCQKKCSIQEAMNLMFELGFRRLVLENGGYTLVSSRDFLRLITKEDSLREIEKDQDAFFSQSVENIDSEELSYIAPEKSISEAAEVMRRRNIGSLPVISEELCGIITERDMLLAMYQIYR